jgi:hypothetical protein
VALITPMAFSPLMDIEETSNLFLAMVNSLISASLRLFEEFRGNGSYWNKRKFEEFSGDSLIRENQRATWQIQNQQRIE